MGLPINSSAITNLDFGVLFDISGATPTITITNLSTVLIPANLKWWYSIVTPSGIAVHRGILTIVPNPFSPALPLPPDVNGVVWSTIVVPEQIPTPFGTPPCGQVEFSTNSPYVVTVYVADDPTLNPNPYYALSKSVLLTRPNGNDSNTCGNFGKANASVKIDCTTNPAKIICSDTTNFTYNNVIIPSVITNRWVLEYPPDINGNQPTNGDSGTGLFPYITFFSSYSANGFTLFLYDYCTYVLGDNVSVKVQYKAYDKNGQIGIIFSVLCNINLCKLNCQIHKFYELSKKTCGTLEDASLMNKITRVNLLFSEIITGILQPLCGIDVTKLILEIQKLANLDENCDCGCDENTGVSFTNGGSSSSGISGCCPVQVVVLNKNTSLPPAICPLSYFPADVYDPTGVTVIGTATSADDMVSIINSNAAWMVYGTAFNEGNCVVGFYPANAGTTIPVVKIIPSSTPVVPPVIVTDTMVIVGGSTPPTGCPATTPFNPSLRIYDAAGVNVIGIAYTINDVVSILNGDSSWNVFGTWSVQDNCTVQCNLINPASIPGTIPVDTLSTSDVCVNGKQFYVLNLSDYCLPVVTVVTAADFPLNAVVNFGIGGGNVALGIVADITALIAALNATPTKPAVITFSAGYTINNIVVTNTNCAIYTGPPVVILDKGSANYLLYGANHANMTSPPSTANGQYGIGLHTMAEIGKIPGATANKRKWHTIKQGSVMADTETDTGLITFYDVSTPLFPTVIRTISLNAVVADCFTGIPYTKTLESSPTLIPSLYSLYFPTDTYASMSLNAIVVVESTTGCLWILDMYGSGTGITYSNQFDQLIGKCPRCLINGSLYFTQEGDMETQIGGRPSTVGIGLIPIFDMVSHNISTTTIIANGTEDVWAASFDGVDTIYFSGQFATVVKYTVSTGVKVPYSLLLGGSAAFQYRLNTVYFATVLYWVTQAITGRYCAIMLSTPTLGGTPVIADMQSIVSGTITGGYNFKPLGNCLGVLTIDNFGYGAPGSSILLYKINGQFLGLIDMPTLDIYNVVPISGVGVYSPTSLI